MSLLPHLLLFLLGALALTTTITQAAGGYESPTPTSTTVVGMDIDIERVPPGSHEKKPKLRPPRPPPFETFKASKIVAVGINDMETSAPPSPVKKPKPPPPLTLVHQPSCTTPTAVDDLKPISMKKTPPGPRKPPSNGDIPH
ncbi:hypothetical protein ACLOJK_034538 [Asimina triloba]